MKIFGLIVGTFLIAALIIGISIELFEQSEENSLYRDQAYRQLLSIAESKAGRVSDFISERKKDASFWAGSEDVKNVFDGELNCDVEMMQEKIKSISKKTAGDIEEYLSEHPDMTLEDLQGDEMFKRIAVRDVGETGYTYLNSMGEGILYFHPDPDSRGKSYHAWKALFPLIWKYNEEIAQSAPCEDSYGFYNWEDINGQVREKFTYHSCIKGETADGYSFYVGASTYLDEYGGSISLAYDLDSEFRSLQKEKEYVDIVLINPEGDVIWTAEEDNELGTNLITGIYNDSLLANVFRKAKTSLKVSVSDSGIYGNEGRLKLFITAPVFDTDGRLKGIIALQFDNDRISELIETSIFLEDIGEVYIVNRDSQHISPLRYDDLKGTGSAFHFINSERIENCFKDYDNLTLYGKEIEKTGTYLNYYDKNPTMVLGAHSHMLESEWCIIAEMDESYFLNIIPNTRKMLFSIVGLILFFIFIISFILESLFSVRRSGIK